MPLILSIITGSGFIITQLIEYYFFNFTIQDGSIYLAFYAATGLHGLHAIIGVTALIILEINYIYKF